MQNTKPENNKEQIVYFDDLKDITLEDLDKITKCIQNTESHVVDIDPKQIEMYKKLFNQENEVQP